ncbi:MAG: NAD(P)H-dependent oxidoreductase [Burkholderiales bacterium]|jgi:nitroreductase|nr:NAD(P)H-dependent oxidoreductase [Burkholderiales bacterium]
MNDFMKAIQFRHACKLFDEKRKIPDDIFRDILEAGRLSPSSFGLEPWHFLVIQNEAVKAVLRSPCWNQPQVTTCSHFVVLLVRIPQEFERGSAYLDDAFARRAPDPEKRGAIKEAFDNFLKKDLKPDVLNWGKMQTYIAGANMMTAAAFAGVDSCPIEGFNFDELTKTLAQSTSVFDKTRHEIAFCIAFGYRAQSQGTRIRWSIEKVASFI